ncbi:MAG: rRNA maturation RNase YbeY [Spirochaetes bacterium]|nr:rRNA maturation RNase YbeY [Spirochaetota bacterium]MBU0954332.1 rRNA maturation RNase YbeY [Spirochaetota bacterium]
MNRIFVSIQTGPAAEACESETFSGTVLEAFSAELPDFCTQFAARVLEHRGKEGLDVSIVLCDDAFIADLNSMYRQKDGPTDVLSFEQGESYVSADGVKRILAGDIVIALPSVQANAGAFGVAFTEELQRVIVHGLLHLDGMDHATNEPAEAMLQLQEQLLKELN